MPESLSLRGRGRCRAGEEEAAGTLGSGHCYLPPSTNDIFLLSFESYSASLVHSGSEVEIKHKGVKIPHSFLDHVLDQVIGKVLGARRKWGPEGPSSYPQGVLASRLPGRCHVHYCSQRLSFVQRWR